MRIRGEAVRAEESGASRSNGYLIFLSLRQRFRIGAWYAARFICFDTDDYDSAMYEYEDDLPGRVTIQPLWGEGYRVYLTGGYVRASIKVSAKLSRTYGDHESSEFSFQVDYPG